MRRYYLKVHLLCHDIRVSYDLEFVACFSHRPSEEEALRWLEGPIEEYLAKRGGEGCPYELSDLRIEDVPADER